MEIGDIYLYIYTISALHVWPFCCLAAACENSTNMQTQYNTCHIPPVGSYVMCHCAAHVTTRNVLGKHKWQVS